MVTAQAPNRVVGGIVAAWLVKGTRGSVEYAVEAICTFSLVFTVGAAVGSASPFALLGLGAVLVVMVSTGGQLSGGHYNPAVTLAMLMRRRVAMRDAIAHWIVQFGSGLLAAVVVRIIVDPAQVARSAAMNSSSRTLVIALVLELLFTFALCYVVLNVATSERHSNNSYYGLALGFTVSAGAFAVAAISGGPFNPEASLGTAVMGMFAWPTLWVYLVAQILAGLAAGVTFLALDPTVGESAWRASPLPDQPNPTDNDEALR
jgi:aquaporin Z